MKKILLYFLGFIAICFLIPVIFTKEDKQTSIDISDNVNVEENQESNQNKVIEEYDYKNYKTIKLLHSANNEIEEMPLDEYLYGVVSAEMPASFENEALKAQAIVARTYTVYKIIHNNQKHEGADICDNASCCQAWISKEDRLAKWAEDKRQEYWDKIVRAVDETKGKVVTYNGEPINAFFHSNSGGKTETTVNVWGGGEYPYLQSVETAGEEAYSQYSSELTITKGEFINKIKKEHSDFEIDFENQDAIKILEYTDGNRIKKIKVGNLELSGVEIRTIFNLKSANFEVQINQKDIVFSVVGYGHGVGMSQTGADSMAKNQYSYEEIIKHFYTGVEITNL